MSYFSMSFKRTLFIGQQVISRMELNLVSNNIIQNIKTLLAADSPIGCPVNLSQFRDLRSTATPTTLNYDLDSSTLPPNCITNPTGDANISNIILNRIKSISINISSLEPPRLSDLTTKVQIEIKIQEKPKKSSTGGQGNSTVTDSFGLTSQVTKRFQLRVAKTSFFNVIFTGLGSGSLINLEGNAKVQFNGTTLLSSSDPIDISNISSSNNAAGIPDSEKVFFLKTFYSIAPTFKAQNFQAGTFFSIADLKQAFRGGIETSALKKDLAQSVTVPYPNTETNAWTLKYDYSKIMPLPSLAHISKTAYASMSTFYEDSKASFTTIPNSTSGIPDLTSTCPTDYGASPYQTPTIFRYDASSFVVDFTQGGTSFCGLIATHELKILTGSATGSIYQMIGNFLVDKITISGNGTVIFFNPADGDLLRIPLESGTQTTSTSYVNSIFAQLATGNGRQFFTPILMGDASAISLAKTQTKLWPQRPSQNTDTSGLITSCSFSGAPASSACYVNSASIDDADVMKLWTLNLKPAFFVLDTL